MPSAEDDLAAGAREGPSVGLRHRREARDVALARDHESGNVELAEARQGVRVAPARRDPSRPVASPVVEDNLTELLEERLVLTEAFEERVVEPDLRGGCAVAFAREGDAARPGLDSGAAPQQERSGEGQRADPVGVLERQVRSDGGAERVRDEMRAINPRDVERAKHIGGGVDLTELTRLRAKAGQIERENAVVVGERDDLLLPHARIEREPVEEDESGLSLAGSARLRLRGHSHAYSGTPRCLKGIARKRVFLSARQPPHLPQPSQPDEASGRFAPSPGGEPSPGGAASPGAAPSPGDEAAGRRTTAIIVALAFLYTAQGIPFGFATEYLPVVLREQGYSYAGIAALSWLQLPWQLKVLWAKAADSPRLRPHTRGLILVLQLCLTVTVACFAVEPLAQAATLWFALTALAAALAATQDVFVDAFAVRVLLPSERGFGNTAQVAGYRLGMLIGGAALLLFVERLGERTTLLGCAGLVAFASLGAFAGSKQSADAPPRADAKAEAKASRPSSVRGVIRHMVAPGARPVIVLALTFKLGLHMASSLLKPMAKDFGWSKERIGWAVVTVGSAGALLGAALGGVLHRKLGERRALMVAVVVQTLVCLPLVAVERLHAPLGLTTFAIFIEHFGSGFGTTILFAALMSATRPADAGLHYTILTSANAVAIGIGGLLGGVIADRANLLSAFVVASLVSALPALLLPRWGTAAVASADDALPIGDKSTTG